MLFLRSHFVSFIYPKGFSSILEIFVRLSVRKSFFVWYVLLVEDYLMVFVTRTKLHTNLLNRFLIKINTRESIYKVIVLSISGTKYQNVVGKTL